MKAAFLISSSDELFTPSSRTCLQCKACEICTLFKVAGVELNVLPSVSGPYHCGALRVSAPPPLGLSYTMTPIKPARYSTSSTP